MTEDPKVAAARLEVEEAKARLVATAAQIQDRLNPRTLAHDAWESAKGKTADLAEDAVDAVKARPLAAGGVAAALALFLAREPLMDLAGRVAHTVSEKRTSRKQRKTKSKSMKEKTS